MPARFMLEINFMITPNKKQKTSIRNSSGFTLVEMLVAIGIFLSVMVVAVGSLISIIDANRRSQAIKNVVDNVTFAIENISRDMRNGTDYKCLVSSGGIDNGNCENGGTEISYTPSGGVGSIHYRYVPTDSVVVGEGNIQKCIDNGGGCLNWQSMTAPTSIVNITNMTFYVLGVGITGGTPTSLQPRVIITAVGLISDKYGKQTNFNLQTTASQRTRRTFQ